MAEVGDEQEKDSRKRLKVRGKERKPSMPVCHDGRNVSVRTQEDRKSLKSLQVWTNQGMPRGQGDVLGANNLELFCESL